MDYDKMKDILVFQKSIVQEQPASEVIDLGNGYILVQTHSEAPEVTDRALGYGQVDLFEVRHPNFEQTIAALSALSGEAAEPLIKIGVILADFKAPGLANNVHEALTKKYGAIPEAILGMLRTTWGDAEQAPSITKEHKVTTWRDVIEAVKKHPSSLQKSDNGMMVRITGHRGWHKLLNIEDSGIPAHEEGGGNHYHVRHNKTGEVIKIHQSGVEDMAPVKDLKKIQYYRKGMSSKLEKPPKSEAQRRFMGAVAHGDVAGVSPSVGQEYLSHDTGSKLPEKLHKEVADKPPVVRQAKPVDYSPILSAIGMMESSGGKHREHSPQTSGLHAGTRAISTYGLMPKTVHELVNKFPKFQSTEVGKRLKAKGQFDAQHINDITKDPKADDEIMRHLWEYKQSRVRTFSPKGADLDAITAYAHRHGITAAKRKLQEAGLEGIQADPYVQEFNRLKAAPKQDNKKSLEKFAAGSPGLAGAGATGTGVLERQISELRKFLKKRD